MGLGIHILVDGANWSREVGSLDSFGQFGTGRLHQGRVESATHLEGQSTACAGLLEFLASSLDGSNLTRDNHLTGTVVIGGDTDAVDGGADFLHLLVGQADDGCHRRGSGLTSLLHGQGTSLYQFQTLLKGQCASGYQSRELAQRVASNHIGFELVAHGECEDYRVQEYGGLGDLGLLQVILGAFKHEVGDAEAQHLVSLLKQFFGLGIVVIQVLAHTDELCALTGEYECFHCLDLYLVVNDVSLFQKRLQMYCKFLT